MSEQLLDKNNGNLISSREAAKLYRVSNDYIARLCKNGKLRGRLAGRSWQVEVVSLQEFFTNRMPVSVPQEAIEYITSRSAAKMYRVSHDYVARLCRQGKIAGVRDGRNWKVEKGALVQFFAGRTPYIEAGAGQNVVPQAQILFLPALAASPAAPKKKRSLMPLALVCASLFIFAALFGAMRPSLVAKDATAALAQAGSPFFFGNPFDFFSALFSRTAVNSQNISNGGATPNQLPTAPDKDAATPSTPAGRGGGATYTYPIVERIIEHTTEVSGLSEATLDQKLGELDNRIRALLFSTISVPNSLPASGGTTNNIALSQRIDKLDGTTLTDVTVHGISGLTANDIPALDYLTAAGDTTFSTTSASYFSSLGLAFSTTSTNYFVEASTTIPKIYSANTFTNVNAFNGGLTAATILATGSTTLQDFTANFATTSQATTTTFAITSITSSLLKTLANGAVVAAVAGTDYQAAGNVGNWFTPTTNFGALANSTSTPIWFQSGIQASSTSYIASTTFAINGNVGIGTTSPTQALTIGNGGILIDRTGNEPFILFTATSTSVAQIRGVNGGGLRFTNGSTNSEWARFDSSGNFGVGTTSPWARLSVDTTSLATGVPSFTVGSSTRTDLVVTQSGKVGIGTTSPNATLHVAASVFANQLSLDNTFGTSWKNQISFQSTSTERWALGNDRSGTGAQNFFLWDGVNQAIRLLVDGNGNVGIGTTSPTNNLHVTTATNAGGITIDGNNNPALTISGTSTPKIYLGLATGASSYAIGSVFGDAVLRTQGGKLLFDTNSGVGTPALTILGANGSVGIGTTSPPAKLTVDGNILLASSSPSFVYNNISQGSLVLGMFASSTGGASNGAYFQTFGNNYTSASQRGGAEFVFDTRNSGTGGFSIFGYEGSTWTNYFKVATDGNVGIGDSTPNSLLTVGSGDPFQVDTTGTLYQDIPSATYNIWIQGSVPGTASGEARNLALLGNASGDDLILNYNTEYDCVSVGGTSCAYALDVNGSGNFTGDVNVGTTNTDPVGNNVVGSHIDASGYVDINRSAGTAGYFGRTTDGAVVGIASAGTVEGFISISGATVSYGAFTGSHYALLSGDAQRGELMTLTGNNKNYHDNPESEVLYGIEKSTKENDPQILGAYLALIEPADPRSVENPDQVMAVGNGDMWVADTGSDLNIGDYLISSAVPGHAMKDPGTFATSYIIARVAEPVHWGTVSDEIGGIKHKKVSVFFENFTRSVTVDIVAAIATSSASTTPAQQAAATSFFSSLFAHVTSWLASSGNGILDLFAATIHAENVYADTVHAKTLCAGAVCVDEAGLGELLQYVHHENATTSGGGASEPTATTTPTVVVEDTIAASTTPVTEVASDATSTPPVADISEPTATPEIVSDVTPAVEIAPEAAPETAPVPATTPETAAPEATTPTGE